MFTDLLIYKAPLVVTVATVVGEQRYRYGLFQNEDILESATAISVLLEYRVLPT